MRNILYASAVLLGLSIAVAQAEQTSTSYNLKPNKCKVMASLPVQNAPIHFMATNAYGGVPGSAGTVSLTISSITNADGAGDTELNWIGWDTTSGETTGLSGTPGTHIIWISGYTEAQVWTGESIRVCNSGGTGSNQKGLITMLW